MGKEKKEKTMRRKRRKGRRKKKRGKFPKGCMVTKAFALAPLVTLTGRVLCTTRWGEGQQGNPGQMQEQAHPHRGTAAPKYRHHRGLEGLVPAVL